jgi:rhodanese-related sulfurtransferase
VNVSPAGGGTITSPQFSPPPTTYPSRYTCSVNYTLTAVPNAAAGYSFDRWTGSVSSTANPLTVSVKDGEKVVTAVFAFKAQAIDMNGVLDLMNSQPGPLMLDVSSAADFNNSHILCARNYPWNAARQQFDVSINLLNPYKKDIIVIYDQSGARSRAAADYLAGMGYSSMYYMTAGLDDWIAAGYDTYVPAEDEDICTSLAPMAYADTDQNIVNEGVKVTLDGSMSEDPKGGVLTYSWTQFKGSPNVTLTDDDKARATFTSPFLTSGNAELMFHLTITNNIGQKHTDSVNVTVLWFNDPPRADAGGEQTVEPASVVTLDGSASHDPEGEPLSYKWSRSGGTFTPSLSSTTAAKPTFTAPASSGWAEFMLTVTDNGGKTDTDTVRIMVQASSPTNDPPTAVAAADKTGVLSGEKVTLDGSGSSDADGTIAAYVWTQTDATGKTVTLSNPAGVKPSFTAPEVTKTVTLVFTLMVTDNDDAIDTDTVEITVNKPNEPPTAVAAADKTSVSSGEKVTLDGSGASDPDGTIAAYAWTQTDATGKTVTLSNPAGVKPSFTAPEVTETVTLIFKLTVTDNSGAVATDTIRITVAKSAGGGGGGGCFIRSMGAN